MLDYQLTVLLVKVIRTYFSENSEPVWDVHVTIHMAPLACYLFINIKLAAYHLLLYVVYLYQKSLNFVHALICYKQKCKVVSLNLAHPVDHFGSGLYTLQQYKTTLGSVASYGTRPGNEMSLFYNAPEPTRGTERLDSIRWTEAVNNDTQTNLPGEKD